MHPGNRESVRSAWRGCDVLREGHLSHVKKLKIEFGDFQTPSSLAYDVCAMLHAFGISEVDD